MTPVFLLHVHQIFSDHEHSHIFKISKRKRCFNVKPSTCYFHMKRGRYWQIFKSAFVPLILNICCESPRHASGMTNGICLEYEE